MIDIYPQKHPHPQQQHSWAEASSLHSGKGNSRSYSLNFCGSLAKNIASLAFSSSSLPPLYFLSRAFLSRAFLGRAFLCGGVLGSSLILLSQTAWAKPASDRVLLAQQIVDGLPPPPPLIFGQEIPPGSSQSNQAQPNQTQSNQAAPSAPAASSNYQAASAQRYAVLVNGDSPLLLSQVQTVAAGASVQQIQGKRIIQAGVFDDSTQAQQQAAALASQGIEAQVFAVGGAPASGNLASTNSPSTNSQSAGNNVSQANTSQALPPPDLLPVAPVPREVEFGQPSSDGNQSPDSSTSSPNSAPNSLPGGAPDNSSTPDQQAQPDAQQRSNHSYYVVIPGKSGDLAAISNQVARLGDGMGIEQVVQETTKPRGPHVQVGPFADRNAATRWSRYFRDFGLDARVYYNR